MQERNVFTGGAFEKVSSRRRIGATKGAREYQRDTEKPILYSPPVAVRLPIERFTGPGGRREA
jgi:hypothetical protein